jgi:hypothetical protein
MRFTEFTKLSYGPYSKGISLSLPSGDPVRFQIPKLYVPFGISGFPNKYGPTKYSVDLSMRGWDQSNTYVNKFFTFLTTLEEQVIQHVREKNILGSEPEKHFNSNVKFSGSHDPRFRVKIDRDTLFFDANGVNSTPDLEEGLFKGKSMTALIELKNIYFFNEKMGLTWTIVDAKVTEPLNHPVSGPKFIEGGDEEDEDRPTKTLTGFQFK